MIGYSCMIKIYSSISKSRNFQYSEPPFGRGRLTINGIFFVQTLSMQSNIHQSMNRLFR